MSRSAAAKTEGLLDVSPDDFAHRRVGHGQIVGASKIARDITDRKLAEAALVKSEKLATAGRLAATLAHEINNPLQAVTGISMTLLGKSLSALGSNEQGYMAMAEEELEPGRASDSTISQFLSRVNKSTRSR